MSPAAAGSSSSVSARGATRADDGLARAINPSHTVGDGDTVFALATGRWTGQASLTAIGALAAEALSMLVSGVDLKQGTLKPWYER